MGCPFSKSDQDVDKIDIINDNHGRSKLEILLTGDDISFIPKFPFAGKYNVRVESVYDGDTMWLAFIHDQTIFRFKLRVEGIDTPELRGTYVPVYKEFAQKAKRYVENLLMDTSENSVKMSSNLYIAKN